MENDFHADEGLPKLHGMKRLEQLDLSDSQVDKLGRATKELKAAADLLDPAAQNRSGAGSGASIQ